MKLLSLALDHLWLLPLVATAVKQSKTTDLSARDAADPDPATLPTDHRRLMAYLNTTCHSWTCGKGYVPKDDHHTIEKPLGKSLSDFLCCERTCELYQCGQGFVANPAYYGNIGQTDPQCCDVACGNEQVECQDGYVLVDEDRMKPGVNSSDCCRPTCALAVCVPPLAYPDDSRKLRQVTTNPNICCDVTCSGRHCPPQTAHIREKLQMVPRSDAECCSPTCETVTCKNGYEPVPGMLHRTAYDGERCCQMKCGDTDELFGYKCSKGWIPQGDMKSCPTQPCTDKHCCIQTCDVFNCPDDWVKDDSKMDRWPGDRDLCCLPSCKLHTCGAGYVPGSNRARNTTIGGEDEICCDKMCSLHTCDNGTVVVPGADAIPGDNQTTCCENNQCPLLRNMTKMAKPGCNAPDTPEACNAGFTVLNNSASNTTEYVRCVWDSTFSICRVSDPHSQSSRLPTDCYSYHV